MFFGCSGSLGTEFATLYNKDFLIVNFSRDEMKQKRLSQHVNYQIIGDIGVYEDVYKAMAQVNPSLIVVASAMKHIEMCEKNMEACHRTNVIGPMNVIRACRHLKPGSMRRILFISTDKACEPKNYYGCCKALSEKLFINTHIPNHEFMAIRYGNVLNSSGSILTLLDRCTDTFFLTHPDMTRFFITLEDACKAIYDVLTRRSMESGKIYVPKATVKSAKIRDLVETYFAKTNKDVHIGTGIMRPGEKINENLCSKYEELETRLDCDLYKICSYDREVHPSLSSDTTLMDRDVLDRLIQKFVE